MSHRESLSQRLKLVFFDIFCVQFAGSPHVCVDSLHSLWLYHTDELVTVNWPSLWMWGWIVVCLVCCHPAMSWWLTLDVFCSLPKCVMIKYHILSVFTKDGQNWKFSACHRWLTREKRVFEGVSYLWLGPEHQQQVHTLIIGQFGAVARHVGQLLPTLHGLVFAE